VSAPSPDQPRIRFVTVDGVRLRTSVRGVGRPLLLVTGLGASLELTRPVDVLGVSLGGVVAQQLAHQAPRRVRRLVLAATGPGLGASQAPRVSCCRWRPPGHLGRPPGQARGNTSLSRPEER
jgi:poly(3-hydroxyoctanoate) depolymerase